MSSKQYSKPSFESLGLTIEKLPVGSPERAIAETIQHVMKLDGCALNTALDRVRNNLMQANVPLDCAVWGQAKAAAEATLKPARKTASKVPSPTSQRPAAKKATPNRQPSEASEKKSAH